MMDRMCILCFQCSSFSQEPLGELLLYESTSYQPHAAQSYTVTNKQVFQESTYMQN